MKITNALKRRAGKTLAWLLDAAEPSPDRSARVFWDRRVLGAEDAIVSPYEREQVIAQCRDLVRNNAVTRGIISRLQDMVVGRGITPRATTASEEWNSAAERLWFNWANAPEPTGLLTLTDVQSLCVSARLVEGGAAILKHADGKIELVELERFRASPDDSLGGLPYRLNSAGAVDAWCVWDRDERGGFGTGAQAHWVPASQMLVMFPRDRADQIIPLPQLASCVNQIRDLTEVNAFTLRQAKAQAVAAFVHQKQADGQSFGGRRFGDSGSGFDQFLNALQTVGFETTGTVTNLSPNTPSSTYNDFVMLNLKLIASAISVPLDVLMMWFSDGTYSSNKTTLSQAHEAVVKRQAELVRSILRPMWVWKMVQAVQDGLLPAPPECVETGLPAYEHVDFRPPAFEWVDPTDALQSTLQAVQAGVSTLSEECEKRGTTLEGTLRRKAADILTIKRVADETGIPVEALSQVVIQGASNLPQTPTGVAVPNNGKTSTGVADDL